MNANDNETVREVCADINNDCDNASVEGWEFCSYDVRKYLDRILSAYEREMAAKDAEIERLMVNGRGGADSRLHRIIDEMERTAHTDHGHTNGTWRELMDYFVAAFRSVAIDMGESWARDAHGSEVPLT